VAYLTVEKQAAEAGDAEAVGVDGAAVVAKAFGGGRRREFGGYGFAGDGDASEALTAMALSSLPFVVYEL
jgi:hypothetical protein